jgi:hypothetical protein
MQAETISSLRSQYRDAISVLRSQYAVLTVLVIALVAQMPHAQHVFYLRGHDMGWASWLQSWGFAIALEVAVLVFVVRGNVRASWGFATFSIAINLAYYAQTTGSAWYMSVIDWLLSVGLPVAIALYSHEVSEPQATGEDATTAAAQEVNVDATAIAQSQPGEVVGVDGFAALLGVSPHEFDKAVRSEMVAGASELAQPVADEDATTKAQPPPVPPSPWTAVVASHLDEAQPLDEMAQRILDAIATGARTPYAISKRTEIPLTTLRRKQGDTYIGRLPKMVAAGYLRNGGDEYKLVDNA